VGSLFNIFILIQTLLLAYRTLSCKFTVIFKTTIMKPLMIPKIFTIILCVVLLQDVIAQAQTWDQTYNFGSGSASHCTKLLKITGGDLLLAGYSTYSWGSYAPGFIRLDSNGIVKSNSLYLLPDSYQQFTHTLVQVSDNAFYSFSFNPNIPVPVKQIISGFEPINHSWLLKLNADGDTLATFYCDSIGDVRDMVYYNGSLIAVGSTNYEFDNYEFESKTTLLISDTLGNQMLRKEYLVDHDSRANSILRLENGNYLIGGYTIQDYHLYDPIYPDRMFLLETDSLGNLLWSHLSDIPYSQVNKIIQCDDGSFAMIGDGQNAATLKRDIILWRMNAAMEIDEQLFFDFSGTDNARSIKQTPDGGFIACGNIWVPGPPSRSVFFYMKLDADGSLEWYTHNTGNYHHGNDVILNGEHGYFIAGYGQGAKLVKADLLGNGLITSTANHNLHSTSQGFNVYPNPGTNYLYIASANDLLSFHFELFNNLSEPVISLELSSARSLMDTGSLPAGFYYYRIFSGNEISQSGVWVKK
jgi:hypothetical protein